MNYLLVFIGGGMGSSVRYGVNELCRWVHFPVVVATLLVNVVASLVLGLVLVYVQRHGIGGQWRLLLATGFCGGFSTFSTFSYDNLALLEQGAIGLLLLNVLLNVVICLGAVLLGTKIAMW